MKLNNNEKRNTLSDKYISMCCGLLIKRKRKERGLTGAELAYELGISQQQMSRYERGVNKLNIDMLFVICMILNFPLEKLIKDIIYELENSSASELRFLKMAIVSHDTTYFSD